MIKRAGQHEKPPTGQEYRRSNGATTGEKARDLGRGRELGANQVRGAALGASTRASLAGTAGASPSGRMLKSCSTPPMASAKGGVATAPP
ncbi:hypothetical protein D3C76_1720920 [compost metagenome]